MKSFKRLISTILLSIISLTSVNPTFASNNNVNDNKYIHDLSAAEIEGIVDDLNNKYDYGLSIDTSSTSKTISENNVTVKEFRENLISFAKEIDEHNAKVQKQYEDRTGQKWEDIVWDKSNVTTESNISTKATSNYDKTKKAEGFINVRLQAVINVPTSGSKTFNRVTKVTIPDAADNLTNRYYISKSSSYKFLDSKRTCGVSGVGSYSSVISGYPITKELSIYVEFAASA